MNVTIIHKNTVTDQVLDVLALRLPAVIAGALEVPGGNVAPLKPEQVALAFVPASRRDSGSDLRTLVYAKKIDLRLKNENELAQTILEKVCGAVREGGGDHSVNVRLYFMDIGTAEYSPAP